MNCLECGNGLFFGARVPRGIWRYRAGSEANNFKGASRLSRQMTSETAHLVKCLQQIHKVIGKANEILAGISHPSVCSEVLLSKPGTAYILGLTEVYRVSKRMEDGVKTRQLASEPLQHTLREVDLAWNNLLSFLVLGHPTFQMLVQTGNSDPVIYKGSWYHASWYHVRISG